MAAGAWGKFQGAEGSWGGSERFPCGSERELSSEGSQSGEQLSRKCLSARRVDGHHGELEAISLLRSSVSVLDDASDHSHVCWWKYTAFTSLSAQGTLRL